MNIDSNATLSAQWFDGRSARRSDATLFVHDDRVFVRNTVDADGLANVVAEVPLSAVIVSERIGDTPYRLNFPDGALAVTADHAAVESVFHLTPSEHWLARMERASWVVVVAMIGLGAALYFAYQALIPMVATAVATRIPHEAEKTLGTVALGGLDRWMLKTSRLEANDLATVRTVFESLADKAGLGQVVELQFRDMVPNALALPGGTVIVTDGLVRLFRSDERLLAGVIAHELGHVHHRHSLRHLLEGSASALIVGALIGDVSGVSALATGAPLVLSTLHYTREAEMEADQYAFDLLKKSGRSPTDFADAMRRFEAMELCIALRNKSRDVALAKPGPSVDRRDDRVAREHLADACLDEPERTLEGRESEVDELRRPDRETGYMHTHPVTQERIRAADAAAK